MEYKDADYSKVDEAIAKANALNKDKYKDFSAVETAINAVVRGKNITEQAEVDAMAKAINDAVASMEKKPDTKPIEPDKKPTEPDKKPTDDTKFPQTGDNSNMWLWVTLLFVSGSGVIGTIIYRKKRTR